MTYEQFGNRLWVPPDQQEPENYFGSMEQNRSTDVWLEVVGGSAEAAHSVSAASLFLPPATATGVMRSHKRAKGSSLDPSRISHIRGRLNTLGVSIIKDGGRRNIKNERNVAPITFPNRRIIGATAHRLTVGLADVELSTTLLADPLALCRHWMAMC